MICAGYPVLDSCKNNTEDRLCKNCQALMTEDIESLKNRFTGKPNKRGVLPNLTAVQDKVLAKRDEIHAEINAKYEASLQGADNEKS